jgi:hypothetical protein
MIVVVAAATYAVAVALGLTATRTSVRFGRWHHAAFAVSCISAIAAAVIEPHASMIVPLSMLAVMPFTRGGSRPHALVGLSGAVGWVLVLLARSV